MRLRILLLLAGLGVLLSCGGLLPGEGDAPPKAGSGALTANTLSALSLSTGLSIPFDPDVRVYDAFRTVPSLFPLPVLTITATPTNAAARVTVAGVVLAPGVATEIPVSTGKSEIDISVSTEDGAPVGHYTIRLAVRVEQKITYIKPFNTEDGMGFATALALDGTTLVVGADGDRSAGTGVGAEPFTAPAYKSGAVFVFTREGGTWKQQAYIKPPNTHETQRFGAAVQLKGDVLVVGAPSDTKGTGAVFIYQRAGSTWSLKEELHSPTPAQWSFFGMSLALGDDALAIGSMTNPEVGNVDIFVPGPTTWVHQAHLSNAARTVTDMAFSGNELAVGAPTISGGTVNFYTRSGTTWSETNRITATPAVLSFGARIVLRGDELVVAAPHAKSGTGVSPVGGPTNRGGVVYVFRRSGGAWAQEAMLEASNARPEAFFGESIALSRDVLAIGASGESSFSSGFDGNPDDASKATVGAAYLFTRSGTTWMQRAYLKPTNPQTDGNFGSSIGLSPTTLVVGAFGEGVLTRQIDGPQAPITLGRAGATYVY